ncbi:MAG: 4a-hydroxytetrahydrobiopterin dehydratase [Pseudomonadota bacterium]
MTESKAITSASLREKKCAPCEGGVDPLKHDEIEQLMPALHGDWRLDAATRRIERHLQFPGYSRTLAFVNAVAWIANVEGHHPLIEFGYGHCSVVWTTNAINGLSVNDFICAAKTDELLVALE